MSEEPSVWVYTEHGAIEFTDPGCPIYDSVVVDLDFNPKALRALWSIEAAEARLREERS